MSREDVYPKEKSDGWGRTGHVFIGVGIGKVVNLQGHSEPAEERMHWRRHGCSQWVLSCPRTGA